MKNLYLFRLFNHSKWAGVSLVIFLSATICLYNKKIDWLLIPRNDMFSGQPIKSLDRVPRLYLNHKPIQTSGMFYWKRDFLEQSIQLYEKAAHQKKIYQLDWLKRRSESHTWLNIFETTITPSPTNIKWYAKIAGVSIRPQDIVEIRVERLDSNYIHQKFESQP